MFKRLEIQSFFLEKTVLEPIIWIAIISQ